MADSADGTPCERILDAAEAVLRRHGAEKTNVIDVARVLGMSHGNIYRHFDSKKALLDAVAVRWLATVTGPLAAIAADTGRPAADRLADWFDTLRTLKRRKVLEDPELFRAYHTMVVKLRDVTDGHIAALVGQLRRIVADGITAGEFSSFLHATMRFHHPSLITLDPPPTDAEARTVFALLLAGLRSGPA